MKLLNLCCGNCRKPSTPEVEWTNLDNLHESLLIGTPERDNLNVEKNYVNCDVLKDQLPFPSNSLDGILASHCLEHWTCQEAASVLTDCHHVLKPGGVMIASVPDASYFWNVRQEDTMERAEELFGEPIFPGDGETTFTGYALWNRYHKAIINEEVMKHYFRRAGFGEDVAIWRAGLSAPHWASTISFIETFQSKPVQEMIGILNRLKFSLVMIFQKQ